MMKTLRKVPTAIAIAAVLAIPACTEDYFDLDRLQEGNTLWNPDLAIPLVFSNLTVEDIISNDEQNSYVYDDDNFITLVYSRVVFSESLNEFMRIQTPQGLGTDITLNASEIATFTTNGQAQKTVSPPYTLAFDQISDAQLDRVIIANGDMTLNINSDFQHSGTLTVSMPDLRLNGVAYVQSFALDYSGGPVNLDISVPLAGYEMTLNQGGIQNVTINYTLNLQNGGAPAPIPSQRVNVNHSFTALQMSYAEGYFGQFDLEIPEGVVGMELLDNGALYFEDPRLRLIITNRIGASVSASVEHLYGEGEEGILNFNYSGTMPVPFLVPAPSALGDSTVTEYYFTRENSNINPLVNGQYNNLHHDFSAQINPGGTAFNFASSTDRLDVVAEAELPFWGKSNHYIFEDTLDNPMGDLDDLKDNIEKGLLRINTLNGFPMDGILKLYLMDSLYNVQDSLLANGEFVIRSGPVDNNGKVTSPRNTNNDIELDSTRVNILFGAKYLKVHADLTTTDNAQDNIRIYSDDALQVRIGLQVKLNLSTDDL